MSDPKTRQTVFMLIFEKSPSINVQYDIDGNNYAIRGTHVAEMITADNILASWTRKMPYITQRPVTRELISPRYSSSELNARHRIDVDSEFLAVRTPDKGCAMKK